jgi:hypothetical protein
VAQKKRCMTGSNAEVFGQKYNEFLAQLFYHVQGRSARRHGI